MRRLKVLLLQFIIIALILSLCPIQVSAETANEPSSWAAQQISILKMLSFGNPDIYSNYQQDITRDEFCMLVSSLYEKVTGNIIDADIVNPFSDISDSPYQSEILKANSLKIVNGVGKGLFHPNGKITRQEVAVMIYNTIRAIHPDVELTANKDLIFRDDAQIASWARPATAYLYDNYFMSGISELTIGPLQYTTREQALLLMFKAGILTGFMNDQVMQSLTGNQISRNDDGMIEVLDTGSAEEYWMLGRKYTLGDKYNKMPRKGIAAYDKAIEMDPDFYLAYRDKAEAYFLLGMYAESMESISKALQLNDADGWCFVHRGKLYSAGQETDKAIADFTKGILMLTAEDASNPDLGGIYTYRARNYLQKMMIKEAVSDLNNAARYDFFIAQVMLLLGIK